MWNGTLLARQVGRRLRAFVRLVGTITSTAIALGVLTSWLVAAVASTGTQGGFALDAKTLNTLGQIVNSVGLATWPRYSGDPTTCTSVTEGSYYYNTSTNAFRTCDGSSWADGGGGAAALDELSDVTLSTLTNNDVLRYNSGSGDWENAAASASNIDDLADVAAATPSDGDILVYDGVTDNRWENVAGASPTTLSGLTDTSISGPAQGQRLIHNGSAWANTTAGGSAVLFPFNEVVSNHTGTTSAIIAADNDVRVFRYHFPYYCTVDRIAWNARTVSGTGCDQGAVALYSIDGNTKIVDSGAQSYATSNVTVDADVTNTYVEEGTYWVAYTATETVNCSIDGFAAPTPASSPGLPALFNTGNTFVGTAANQSVAGAMPSTLGTITANTSVVRPIIKFVCTNP